MKAVQTTEPTALAVIQPKKDLALQFTPEQVALIKRTIAKDCSDDELALFMHVAQKSGLDPFAKQVYAIKRGGVMTIQVSIDGARLIASRTGKYEGQSGPFWCGDDGVWKDVWLSDDQPKAAKVGIRMRGFPEPLWGVATFESYAQTDAMGKPTNMWKKMGDVMIAKCAEMIGLRKAAPNELGGLYAEEELANDKTPVGAGTGGGKILPQQPTEEDGNTQPTGYRIPFGKYSQRSLEEVGVEKLRAYVEYLEKKAAKDGKKIKGVVAEFIETASEFVASFENQSIESDEFKEFD